MTGRLGGRRVALLVEEGFSLRQFSEARDVLTAAGAAVVIVAPSTRTVYHDRTGTAEVGAEVAAKGGLMREFDALVIPGGYAPDRLRMRPAVVEMVSDAVAAGKPVAAICHGPQVLISGNVLRGRTLTCWPSIAVDVKNAGGLYVDRPAVNDGGIITARKSDDLPHFLAALTDALAGGS